MIDRVDFRERYRKMSDDELLDVAKDASTLVPEAKDAIETELRNRKLSTGDIAEYAAESKRIKDEQAKSRATPFQFRGFGTAFYGKRDFADDGSYTSTRWFIASGLPLIPLGSYRFRPPMPNSFWSHLGWSDEVLGKTKLDVRQVFYVYGFFAVFVLNLWRLLRGTSEVSVGITAGLLSLAPWALRQYARANAKTRAAASVQ